MYVLLPTLDEIKRTLNAYQVNLAEIRMISSLANAAHDVGISGITMKFVRANIEAGRLITAEEYFSPFIKNMTTILKSKNINIYNRSIDEYRQRQDVIDDLHTIRNADFNTERRRQRAYNAAHHDSMLWHFVYDKRPEIFESPLEAVYWVITNDNQLLKFDKRRSKTVQSPAGICLHPAELVQILQLWAPRNTDMSQALMSALRLPLMFYEFDPGQENISMRILKALSRFDHIDYLRPEDIRDIVLNDSVRHKTANATGAVEDIEIIHDALLTESFNENKEIAAQRDAAIQRAELAEEILNQERMTTQNRAIANEKDQDNSNTRITDLETKLREARETTAKQIDSMQALLDKKDRERRISADRLHNVLIRGVAGGILTAAAFGALAVSLSLLTGFPIWLITSTSLTGWLLIWLFVLTSRIRNEAIREWMPFRRLLHLRNWLLGGLAFMALAEIVAAWREEVI